MHLMWVIVKKSDLLAVYTSIMTVTTEIPSHQPSNASYTKQCTNQLTWQLTASGRKRISRNPLSFSQERRSDRTAPLLPLALARLRRQCLIGMLPLSLWRRGGVGSGGCLPEVNKRVNNIMFVCCSFHTSSIAALYVFSSFSNFFISITFTADRFPVSLSKQSLTSPHAPFPRVLPIS